MKTASTRIPCLQAGQNGIASVVITLFSLNTCCLRLHLAIEGHKV